MQIHINNFVMRQTEASHFSHSDWDWNTVKALVEQNWDNKKQGYREGVVLVDLNPAGFYSSVHILQSGDKLCGSFKSRVGDEEPRKSVLVKDKLKAPAKSVFVVLYSSKVLSEEGDNELPPDDDNWEIISVNASPTEGVKPIDPNTLMYNHFNCDGGTKTDLSDSDFVTMLGKSFVYWKDKAQCV